MFKANAFFVLVTALLISAGCSKKAIEKEKTLNLLVNTQVKGMDPAFADDKYSSNEVGRVYEGLLEYHYLRRPYVLVPNLAEAMPEVSKDGLTYTFKIRKGVLFHDDKAFPNGAGRELTAADFVYSLKRLADPKLQSTGWWVIDGKIAGLNQWRDKYAEREKVDYADEVEGLKALDRYTLQFKLSRPFPQFLYALAMTFTFPVAQEVVEHYGPEFINHPVGTGAFVLPVFTQGNKIVYSRNPKYRTKLFPSDASDELKHLLGDAGKQLPLVEKIVVSIVIESQPGWLNLQKGNVDFMSVPKDNFSAAVTKDGKLSEDYTKKGMELMVDPSLDVTFTAFNHDLKIFKDVRVRQAMYLAMDTAKSNELFYNNTGLPAESIVPPGISGHIKGYRNPFRGLNLEKAKELLAAAGYPDGKGLPEITYDCPTSTVSRQGGEFFQQEMKNLGINIKVITNPWPELQNKVNKRNFMTYGMAWGADYPDAENFLQLLYGPNRTPGANGSGYDNPTFNQLYKSASVMQDSPERTALYEKMVRMAAEEVPIMYGLHRQSYVVKHGWLQNYITTDFETGQAAYLNVDLEKKQELINKM